MSYWSAPTTIVQGVLSFGVDASNNHFLEVCGVPCIRVLSPTQAKQIITQAKQLKERATLPQRRHNAARTGRRTVAFGFASNNGLACAGQGISRRQAPCKPNTVDRTGPSAAAGSTTQRMWQSYENFVQALTTASGGRASAGPQFILQYHRVSTPCEYTVQYVRAVADNTAAKAMAHRQ